jgi:hypothetical protein
MAQIANELMLEFAAGIRINRQGNGLSVWGCFPLYESIYDGCHAVRARRCPAFT